MDINFNKKSFQFTIITGIVLASIALLLSALLVCKHSGVCVASMGCTIDGVDGCAELAGSAYSRLSLPFMSGGLSIASLGFFYYALVLFLFIRLQFSNKKLNPALGLVAGIIIFGLVFDLFLAYRNFFKLSTPCLLCSYTYLCQLGLVFATLWLYFSPRNQDLNSQTSIGASMWNDTKATRFAWGGALLLTLVYTITLSTMATDSTSQDRKSLTSGLLKLSDVERTLREFRALKNVKIEEDNLRDTYIGNSKSAYIKIHEWLDFRCPHCRQGSNALSTAQKRWPGRILVYYRQFPLDGNCNPNIKRKQPGEASCKGARATLCVAEDNSPNNSFFKNFVKSLFNFQLTQTPIHDTSLRKLSEELGGDWPSINRCMNTSETKKLLSKDIQIAEDFGINATPTIIMNQRLLPAGAPEPSWLNRVLDALVLEQEGENAIEDFANRAHARKNQD